MVIGCGSQPCAQALERSFADIDADNTVNRMTADNTHKKLSIATSEIQYRPGAAAADHLENGFQSLFMQPVGHVAPTGLRMIATFLGGISQVQPKRAAMKRTVCSR